MTSLGMIRLTRAGYRAWWSPFVEAWEVSEVIGGDEDRGEVLRHVGVWSSLWMAARDLEPEAPE